MIACVLIPHFATAVERKDDPSLHGIPLIVGGMPWESGKVFSMSHEAAAQGVQPGLPLRQAQALCPQARFLPASQARYELAFEEMLETLSEFTRDVEPGEVHPRAVVYMDIGPLANTEPVEVVQAMAKMVRERNRLAPAIGLAESKFSAYVAAASVEPNEALLIAPNWQAHFLAPRSIRLLPMDIEMARRLHLLGIRTLGQFAALPIDAVMTQLGAQGRLLHYMAQGRDNCPVIPHRSRAVEWITHACDGPISNRVALEALLAEMAAKLSVRLRRNVLVGRDVRLVLHLEDGIAHEEQLVIRCPTARAERLAAVLMELLSRIQIRSGVVEVELILMGLLPATGQQLDLFAHGIEQGSRLHATLKDVTARYGVESFYQVLLTDRSAYLPERRFRLKKLSSS
jgi:DNA polymerase IV